MIVEIDLETAIAFKRSDDSIHLYLELARLE